MSSATTLLTAMRTELSQSAFEPGIKNVNNVRVLTGNGPNSIYQFITVSIWAGWATRDGPVFDLVQVQWSSMNSVVDLTSYKTMFPNVECTC